MLVRRPAHRRGQGPIRSAQELPEIVGGDAVALAAAAYLRRVRKFRRRLRRRPFGRRGILGAGRILGGPERIRAVQGGDRGRIVPGNIGVRCLAHRFRLGVGGRSGRGLGLRIGQHSGLRLVARRCVRRADPGDHRANLDVVTITGRDFEQDAVFRRLHLYRHLVGLEFDQDLIPGHRIAPGSCASSGPWLR